MGAAAYNRGSKHIREQLDRESKARQPEADRTALIENQRDTIDRQYAHIEQLQVELTEAKRALNLETAAHQATITQAEQRDARHYQAMTSLRRSYSDISEKLFSIKPFFKHEAMLLVCDDGSFTLVHPGAGGLAHFTTMEQAQAWAARRDGYIKPRADRHDFHGLYYRVGFNIWPARSAT